LGLRGANLCGLNEATYIWTATGPSEINCDVVSEELSHEALDLDPV